MDNKGALEWLQRELNHHKAIYYQDYDYREAQRRIAVHALEAAIKALEKQSDNKQEAKAVLNNNSDIPDPRCPICHTRVANNFKYCHRCGQKLDWGDQCENNC